MAERKSVAAAEVSASPEVPPARRWANVNPDMPHPRWSQATERVLGTNERRPTLKWNGYGEFVAHLYDGLEKERLFA